VPDFQVAKEYREEFGEQDDDGYYDFVYRYFWFDIVVGGRKYSAKIYTDEPDVVCVMGLKGQPSERELRLMARHFIDAEGVTTVMVIGPSGEFEPVDLEGLFAASD
jgi:hypothetical protein